MCSSDLEFYCGTYAVLEATEDHYYDNGYEFDHWSDGTNDYSDNPLHITVKDDATYTAYFKIKTFDVTFTVNGSPFFLISDVEYGHIITTEELDEVKGKLTLADCESFDHWDYATLIVTAPTTIEAKVKQSQYTIVATTADNTQGTAAGGGLYDCNHAVDLTATPAAGFDFDYWSDGSNDLPDNPLHVIVTQDATYTAYFKPKTFTVTFTKDGVEFHKIEDVAYESPLTQEQLDEAETKVPLNSCEAFVNWIGIPTKVIANVEIQATTDIAHTRIEVATEDNNKGTAVIATDNVNIKYYDCGDIIAITATAKTGYQFVQWSDGNNNNPRTLEVTTEDAIYTAQFEIQQFTITFLNCDGTLIETKTVDYGQGTTAPAVTPSMMYFWQIR